MKEKIYKIGELSKLTNVPVKTIRYYDEFGLLTPSYVDKYTSYRYYDYENVEKLFKILMLKDLGCSLTEIKEYEDSELLEKQKTILERQILEFKNKLKTINSLQNIKGELIMKPFINDENVIGKWKYVASTISIDSYKNDDYYYDDSVFLKNLYFLDGGIGYWIFDRWTSGEIYHFSGVVYKYQIIDGKLFLSIYNSKNEFEIILVFDKEDSKHYKIDDIKIKDNTDMPFVKDDEIIGFWQVCDFANYEQKDNYVPKDKKVDYHLKSINVQPNGECVVESENGFYKVLWTKDFIINKNRQTTSNYIVKTKNDDKYLIVDWKSGDYTFGGKIYGCYVFKKMK